MPLVLGAVLVTMLFMGAVFNGVLGALSPASTDVCSPAVPANAKAVSDIPAAYLALYEKAAMRYGVPWPVLAAIGKTESDHGRGTEPGIHSGANAWGAQGPMQFESATWAAYGVDGNGDGRKDVYDPADAVPAAARLLKADGAPVHLRRAIFAYNHATWYVNKVLALAGRYAKSQGAASSTSETDGCEEAGPPVSGSVATVITYARAQLGKPYVWGAAGPGAFDCSGLTMAAYRHAGVSLPHNAAAQWRTLPHVPTGQEQPGDLVFFVTDGSRSAPGHVGLYIGAGRMIEAPNHTAPVRVSRVDRPDRIGYARPHKGQLQRYQ